MSIMHYKLAYAAKGGGFLVIQNRQKLQWKDLPTGSAKMMEVMGSECENYLVCSVLTHDLDTVDNRCGDNSL